MSHSFTPQQISILPLFTPLKLGTEVERCCLLALKCSSTAGDSPCNKKVKFWKLPILQQLVSTWVHLTVRHKWSLKSPSFCANSALPRPTLPIIWSPPTFGKVQMVAHVCDLSLGHFQTPRPQQVTGDLLVTQENDNICFSLEKLLIDIQFFSSTLYVTSSPQNLQESVNQTIEIHCDLGLLSRNNP